MTSHRPSYQDGVQMLRLVHLLQQSVNHEMHADRLAERLGVSRRTVLRYAEALRSDRVDVGMPALVRERREGGSWIRLDEPARPVDVGPFVYAVAFAGSRIFTAGGGSLLSDTHDHLLEELQADLGQRRPDLISRAEKAFLHVPFGPKRYRDQDDLLDDLLAATVYCYPVRATYHGARGDGDVYEFEPFTIVLYRDGLYVLARIPTEPIPRQWRVLAVDRLWDLTVDRKQTFEVPEDFDPARVLRRGVVGLWPSDRPPEQVRLAFAPEVSIYVRERQWPNASWSERADGWSVLSMDVVVTPEIRAWVMSWGANVEVIEPAALRQHVGAQARVMALRHTSA